MFTQVLTAEEIQKAMKTIDAETHFAFPCCAAFGLLKA